MDRQYTEQQLIGLLVPRSHGAAFLSSQNRTDIHRFYKTYTRFFPGSIRGGTF